MLRLSCFPSSDATHTQRTLPTRCSSDEMSSSIILIVTSFGRSGFELVKTIYGFALHLSSSKLVRSLFETLVHHFRCDKPDNNGLGPVQDSFGAECVTQLILDVWVQIAVCGQWGWVGVEALSLILGKQLDPALYRLA